MKYTGVPILIGAAGLLLAAAFVATMPVLAQTAAAAPPAELGVVVLRSGEAIEGCVRPTADGYCVKVPDGEIRLHRAEVDFCCGSLREAYTRMSSAVVDDANEHLRLAQWCIRQGLLDLAAREVAAARAINPTHPMVEAIERRLEISKEQAQHPVASGPRANQAVSAEELDRMLRTLPPGSIETFTQHVQPVLLNNCTASGCHAVQSETTFRLLRSASDKAASRRVTQRNIFAALQWIDRDNPAASKLLTVPLRPHGQAKTAIFNDAQTVQYRRLADWVDQVTRRTREDPPIPATVEEGPPVQDPPVHAHRKYSSRAQAIRAQVSDATASDSAEFPLASGGDDQRAGAAGAAASDSRRRVQRGGAAITAAKGDPLDPEVFNRRFFGQQQAGQETTR
jgi:hypothetical protein